MSTLSKFSGQRKAMDGLIISFTNTQGERLTLHETGAPINTVKHLCQIALRRDDTYRVTAVSSAELIYRDLKGRQLRRGEGPRAGSWQPIIPEFNLLGKAGLRWMIHPSLAPPTTQRGRPK